MAQDWPELPIAAWKDTYATLQLCSQVVGKIRLALTPLVNEWWNVPLYVTTRGLTTSPMPYEDRTLAIDFDLLDHRVVVSDALGRTRSVSLPGLCVADFHDALFRELHAIDVRVDIHPAPVECPVKTLLSEDREHATYEAEHARRFFEALRRIEPVFQRFRAGFRGKCSPVHFFWGAFDLAVTRFNGKRAPSRPGRVDRLAYDEEVISLGFWPGDPWTGKTEPVFYSYTVPEPSGYAGMPSYDPQLKEMVLPYDAVRRAADPVKELLAFAESSYQTGATLAAWDREALAYP